MCEDPHGPGGDPDRAGTANWAASQIPLDDQGRHTRRPSWGSRGHNVPPPRRGPWGKLLMVLAVVSVLCGPHDNVDEPDTIWKGTRPARRHRPHGRSNLVAVLARALRILRAA